MLDVITDFWKPVKKMASQDKLNPDELLERSVVGFGFVPQVILSGRRLTVSSINTYLFGDERLTSFVLTQDKDPGVSMIVAEAESEKYLAISRRVSISDRMKLFDSRDLENVMEKQEINKLQCKEVGQDYKGWVVSAYRRELQGLKGHLFKGDFRKQSLPAMSQGQEFEYTLLVSENNENAIEIEKYSDGRVELYATIYRRMSDIGEIVHPGQAKEESVAVPQGKTFEAPKQPLSSKASEVVKAEPVKKEESKPEIQKEEVKVLAREAEAKKSEPAKLPEAPKAFEPPKQPLHTAVVSVSEPAKPEPVAVVEPKKPEPVAAKAEAIKQPEAPKAFEPPKSAVSQTQAKVEPAEKTLIKPIQGTLQETQITPKQQEKPIMATQETATNGARNDMSKGNNVFVQTNTPESFMKQEVKAVSSKPVNGLENEAVECDLRVANKIIDEAIRNEMRLSDIVRRIIELPVAYPESVQIPITLADEDYALLAIRYGIPATDRNAIKRRIIDDLNDFSGGKKKAA